MVDLWIKLHCLNSMILGFDLVLCETRLLRYLIIFKNYFANFCIKIACLCDQNGNKFQWFQPVEKREKAVISKGQDWILRLSAGNAPFTLENIKNSQAYRIKINEAGYYSLQHEPDSKLYSNIVELLLVEVPKFLKTPTDFQQKLPYWKLVVKGRLPQGDESKMDYYQSSTSETTTMSIATTADVLEELNKIEKRLEILMNNVAKSGY